MSGAAARCPHCGALQARAPVADRPARSTSGERSPSAKEAPRERPVLRNVTAEEARALIAVQETLAGREPGEEPFNLLAWMFLPDHRSQGGARAAELVLTVLALPILLGGIVGAGMLVTYLSRVRRRKGDRGLSGAVVGLGAITIASVAYSLEWPLSAITGACIGQMLVLAAREWIRGRSKARYATPDLGA